MFLYPPAFAACFNLKVTPAEKMVAICCVCFGSCDEFTLKPDIFLHAGMCSKTFNKAMKALQQKGSLEHIKNKKYKIILELKKPGWINLVYVKIVLNLDLPYHQKLVALAVVKYIDHEYKSCFPKIKTISDIVEASERQVRNTVAELIDMGLLIRYRKLGIWHFEVNDDVLPN